MCTRNSCQCWRCGWVWSNNSWCCICGPIRNGAPIGAPAGVPGGGCCGGPSGGSGGGPSGGPGGGPR